MTVFHFTKQGRSSPLNVCSILYYYRLTCTLGYDSLSVSARREIWKTTLSRIGKDTSSSSSVKCNLSEGEYDFLASAYAEINGRQIKNAVQLATALCRYEESVLTLNHLQETLEMTNVTASTNVTAMNTSRRSIPAKTTPVTVVKAKPSMISSPSPPLVSGVDMQTLDSMVMNQVAIPDGTDDDDDDEDIDMDNLPTDDDNPGDGDSDGASVTC